MIRSIAALGMCAALLATPAFAQTIDAAFTGKVKDAQTGKPLEGVTVIVTGPDLQGSRTTKTDRSGEYRIPQLPVGEYSVLFAKSGYKKVRYTEARLRFGQTAEISPKLPPAPPQPAASPSTG